MDQLVSNIDTDLQAALGCKYTRVTSRIEVRADYDTLQMINGPTNLFHNGPPIVDLYLTFYIDQSAMLSKEDLFQNIEFKIGELLNEVGGVFINRNVVPFGDSKPMTVGYTIKLPDYDTFVSGLNRLARTQSDIEFTKELEKTLTD